MCGHPILSKPLKIRQAPTENWKEVVELWQCHCESFDQFLHKDTKEFIVPDHTSIVDFNKLVIAKEIAREELEVT